MLSAHDGPFAVSGAPAKRIRKSVVSIVTATELWRRRWTGGGASGDGMALRADGPITATTVGSGVSPSCRDQRGLMSCDRDWNDEFATLAARFRTQAKGRRRSYLDAIEGAAWLPKARSADRPRPP